MAAINLSEVHKLGTGAPVPADEHSRLMRAVVGALRSCIHDHGPIKADLITSAAKRVVGSLKNVRPRRGLE